jgi:hypothetical protein
MKSNHLNIIFFLSALLMISVSSFSQEDSRISPYLDLQYYKNTDEASSIKAALSYSANRMLNPLSGMNISFYSGGEKRNLLGTVETDKDGVAEILLPDDAISSGKTVGPWTFNAEFNGNDTIEASSSEISIKDFKLEMTLSEVDSIKTVTLKGVILSDGKEVPAAGELVMIYVPRMFSLLPIAEASLDDQGSASVEFPSDLPGDKDGNVTVISRIAEHPDFGNIEKKEVIDWGIPTEYSVPATHRALWTKTPPTWMIVTLSILLAGVWGHYMFAVISLILIRRDAKRKKAKEEYRL